MSKPIFYDPERKRWKRLRTMLDIIGICIGIVIVVFVASTVFSGESLNSLSLATPSRGYRAMKDKQKGPPRVPSRKVKAKPNPRKPGPNDTVGTSGEGLRAAFYVEWDAGSFSSLKEYYPQIDVIFSEWLHVLSPDGKVQGVTS